MEVFGVDQATMEKIMALPGKAQSIPGHDPSDRIGIKEVINDREFKTLVPVVTRLNARGVDIIAQSNLDFM